MELENTKIEELEAIKVENFEVSKMIKYPLMFIGFAWAFLVFLSMIKMGAGIFNESLGLGLILFLTGIGFMIYGLPIAVAVIGPNMSLEWAENSNNKWEMYGKFISGIIIGVVGSWIAMLIIGLITGFLLY